MRIVQTITAALLLAIAGCHHGTHCGAGGHGGTTDTGAGGTAPTCDYTPDAGPGCSAFAHPCDVPGSAVDVACGYNPDNGLLGAQYCSATACGTCPYCRNRGVLGGACESTVANSCMDGLWCNAGTCANGDGGVGCLTCRQGAGH